MQALEEIVVLDLTRRYPGAYSTMFLGDFGAEVIKVDPPGLASFRPDIDTNSELFTAQLAVDRNKRSMILNLKAEEGLEVFYKLVKRADVLVEGFRPGLMKRLKADYETLKEINPRLIYCSMSGYGQGWTLRTTAGPRHELLCLGRLSWSYRATGWSTLPRQ